MIRPAAVLMLIALVARLPAQAPLTQTRLLPDKPGSKNIYETRIDFPDQQGKGRTGWIVRWHTPRVKTFKDTVENLVLADVHFLAWPDGKPIQVLSRAELCETTVVYSKGQRFYDIGTGDGLLKALDSDLGPTSARLDKFGKVVGELRDRGLLWKARDASRRGHEYVLWAAFKASNYYYIVQYGFQDDGTLTFRMGSTGHNLSKDRNHAHMHSAYWRLDIDLGGTQPNLVQTVRHLETPDGKGHSKQVIEPIQKEGGHDWSPREFTTWRVVNPAVRNAVGHPIAYDLVPLRAGAVRHFGPPAAQKKEEDWLPDEAFTQHDLWVTGFNPKAFDYVHLPKHVGAGRPLDDKSDIVLWHVSAAHHLPRDEDLIGPSNQREPAATAVVWSGFDLKPRDVMAETPFFQWKKK